MRQAGGHAKLAHGEAAGAPFTTPQQQPLPSASGPQMTTRLVTLDEFRCFHGDVETDLPKQKLRFALLVYVALDEKATRTRVGDLLWGDVDEDRARHRLNQSLYAIRQQFGNVIESDGDALRATANLVIDAVDFGRLADAGEHARALELYHRPFLEGFNLDATPGWEHWVDRTRAVLARTYRQSARLQLNALQAAGDLRAAQRLAEQWLALDEDAEDAHAALMQCLAATGHAPDAIAHYQALERRALADGNRVSSRLREIMQAINAQPVARAHVVTGAPPPREAARPARPRKLAYAALVLLALAAAGFIALSNADDPPAAPANVQASPDSYAQAEAAFGRWQLDSAAQLYRQAIQRDERTPESFWRLTQVLHLSGDTSAALRQAAAGAIPLARHFTRGDQIYVSAVAALARRDLIAACEQFAQLIALDSTSFAAWMGLGDCHAFDQLVLADAASASGWSFRSSQHAAIQAYRRALALVPSFNSALVSLGASRLSQILTLDPSLPRRGSTVQGAMMFAFPELHGDTLAFVPYPAHVFPKGWPGSPAAFAGGLVHIRRIALDIARQWVAVFPDDANARESYALALESLAAIRRNASGLPSAIDQAERAARLSRDRVQQFRLAVMLARLHLKAEDWAKARQHASALLKRNSDGIPRRLEYLAPMAGLLGDRSQAANLSGAQASDGIDGIPVPVIEAQLRLHVYAAFGEPADSIRVIWRRSLDGIRAGVEPARQRSALLQLNTRAAALSFLSTGLTPLHEPSEFMWWLLSLQASLARGDTATVRAGIARHLADYVGVGPQPASIDVEHEVARLSLAIGDTATAVATLDWFLDHLDQIHPGISYQVTQSVTLVRAMALRAEIAAAQKDAERLRKWQRAVRTLWSDGDAEARAVVSRITALSAR